MQTTSFAITDRIKLAAAAAVLAASGAIGLALASSGDAAPAQSAAKAKKGKILVARDLTSNDEEIYLLKANGDVAARLTDNDDRDRGGSFSSNGKKIAFVSNREGTDDIFVMNAKGQSETPLTNTDPGRDLSPHYSPSGKQIVFASNRDNPSYQIFLMNAGGSDEHRVSPPDITGYGPKFSADGKWIVFTDSTVNGDIALIHPDGSGYRNLTDTDGDPDVDEFFDYTASFTPDGKRVLFSSERADDGYYNIYSVKLDGSDLRQLTFNEADSYGPRTTLDGRNRILFINEPSGETQEIWSMNSNGKDQSQITFNDLDDQGPEPVPTLECGGKKATIIGTKKKDKLKGGAGKDVIAGLGGKDKLIGAGKKDILCGGKGKDKFDAGGGKDTCIGGGGDDKAKGCNKLKQIP